MFNQDFKEFIESLNANQVRYLVVGGYAVALHGYPRFTKDLEPIQKKKSLYVVCGGFATAHNTNKIFG
jgi:hypothetical protein